MHSLDMPMCSVARDDFAPRLCATIEGVEFWLAVSRGRRLRCVIAESALQAHYGAQAEDPSSWMKAFARHRHDIEARALAAAARRDDVHVVLVNDSAGQLKSAVGRCGY